MNLIYQTLANRYALHQILWAQIILSFFVCRMTLLQLEKITELIQFQLKFTPDMLQALFWINICAISFRM